MRIGTAPDSWGVWFPDDPAQVPWQRFLDEVAQAGYEWVELGPYGYMPTDPARLQDELGRRGMRCSGGTVPASLYDADRWSDDLEAVSKVARLASAVGGGYLVLLPHGPRDIDHDAWCRMARAADELTRIVKSECDVQLVLHPHADTYVETQQQIEQLLADSSVSLCLDTGHVAYRRGDNLALIQNHPNRIGYVHLKQVDPNVLDTVEQQQLTFADAVKLGVCPEPPAGVPSYEPLVEPLRRIDPELFCVVEQDLYPCPPDVPLPIATRTRAYLRQCGFDQ